MRLYSLTILYKGSKVTTLTAAYDLSPFGYFQRSSVKEFMEFTSKILVERTRAQERASVKEQEYVCHVYVRGDSLSGVLISDHEYPQRVSFTLLNKILEEFSTQVPSVSWPTAQTESIAFPQAQEYLSKYQNPRDADPMMRVQQELDETKIVLHNTIEAVLERGEKLDDLVSKSEGLSVQSKAFYKTAKRQTHVAVYNDH